ncbi:hypothetical protein B0H16DRAFT_1879921 [Mycena metata]|uniref:Uncharacterized protein n=1 Tax=Mycena metata TaxID=1033252 RepID=A0AAD7K0G1_9AGAR|nr:hypothetical protein B0H16DRAFT_1879921 [Mycena metata]
MAFICTLSRSRRNLYSPLDTIKVEIEPNPDAFSLMQIYATLRANLPPSRMKGLQISGSMDPEPTLETPVIPVTAIHDLFYFTAVTNITLAGHFGIDIDDDAVRLMAKAWPQLENLQLRTMYPLCRSIRPTLLTKLHMAVDASEVPTIPDNYRHPFHPILRNWDVAESIISDPLPVARFLSGIFGQLNRICVYVWDQRTHVDPARGEAMRRLWAEVEGMMYDRHETREKSTRGLATPYYFAPGGGRR